MVDVLLDMILDLENFRGGPVKKPPCIFNECGGCFAGHDFGLRNFRGGPVKKNHPVSSMSVVDVLLDMILDLENFRGVPVKKPPCIFDECGGCVAGHDF